jgi:hypothetical protein
MIEHNTRSVPYSLGFDHINTLCSEAYPAEEKWNELKKSEGILLSAYFATIDGIF